MDLISQILQKYKTITVIGLSPKPDRASHQIPMYMKSQGYEIWGVYPQAPQIPGVEMRSQLREIPPEKRKFLNVFQSSEKIPALVEEILSLKGTEILWLQLGITHPEAEERARHAGLSIISDKCLLIEHRNRF